MSLLALKYTVSKCVCIGRWTRQHHIYLLVNKTSWFWFRFLNKERLLRKSICSIMKVCSWTQILQWVEALEEKNVLCSSTELLKSIMQYELLKSSIEASVPIVHIVNGVIWRVSTRKIICRKTALCFRSSLNSKYSF